MAQENVVDPVFKRILLAETEESNNKVFRKDLNDVDQRFNLLLADYKRFYIAHGLDKILLILNRHF